MTAKGQSGSRPLRASHCSESRRFPACLKPRTRHQYRPMSVSVPRRWPATPRLPVRRRSSGEKQPAADRREVGISGTKPNANPGPANGPVPGRVAVPVRARSGEPAKMPGTKRHQVPRRSPLRVLRPRPSRSHRLRPIRHLSATRNQSRPRQSLNLPLTLRHCLRTVPRNSHPADRFRMRPETQTAISNQTSAGNRKPGGTSASIRRTDLVPGKPDQPPGTRVNLPE